MHDTPFYDPKHKQLKEAVEKHDKAQELMKNNAKGTEHHKTGLQLCTWSCPCKKIGGHSLTDSGLVICFVGLSLPSTPPLYSTLSPPSPLSLLWETAKLSMAFLNRLSRILSVIRWQT
eukprot:g70299.t1